MIADLSTEEFEALRNALEYAQMLGVASPAGKISYAELAEWFFTSPHDVKLCVETALEKCRNHPAADDIYLLIQ